ncbi:MAG: DUF2470 domain-containing protein [Acetobacteraceae bacterium]
MLMLLSGLSPHTRHLRADRRCSLLVVGEPTGPNPQTAPRLTVVGEAEPAPEPELKARWLARHPYAAFYADLGDFTLWRMIPRRGNFIGGFASAHLLSPEDLAPDPAATHDVALAEAGILGHCNADHPDALDAIANADGGAGSGWRMVACDADGFDVALAEAVRRIAWPEAADGPAAVRKHLIALASAARNPVAPGPGPVV